MSALTPERWARVEVLFHQASAVPAADRPVWLDVHCGDDAELRREVESLLASDSSDVGVTVAVGSALAESARAVAASQAGQRIGVYRVVRELGHGGMGAVFLARREGADFEQQVAIKFLRGVLAADSVDRFRAERRILAPLQHPNIARLIDGGATEDGAPYLVMEYVAGQPIDHYCDEKKLPIRDRLTLFCQVCEAVDVAHRSLIVHRDIKPSNILVTADGVPKLLDFGIAKLLDDSGQAPVAPVTVTGMRMLTPEYASPEQIRGEPITTAADIYSLGVLLFELLTGDRPFTFPSRRIEEIERMVGVQEPPKPSTSARASGHARQLAGDLDTIVLTALRKEPARRYASAAHLADDIRRYLEGRPILARPATWRYRTSRFVTRHRWGVAAAAVIAMLLVGSAIVFVTQAARVQQERDTAEQVITFLTSLFAVADPSESRGNTITAREILDRGVERISIDLKEQPEVQARLLDAMGRVYRELGLFDRSSVVLDQALKLRLGQGGPDDLTTAATMAGLGDALRERGRIDDAEPLVRQALEIRQRLAGPRAAVTAQSLNGLGLITQQRGNWDEAVKLFEESIAILRERLGPADPQLAVGLANVGSMYRDRAQYRSRRSRHP